MKARLIPLILAFLLIAAVVPFSALAESDPLTYQKSSDGTYYIVTACKTDVYDVTVPSTYNGLPVKEIADNAFYYSVYLQYITISENVTTIGDWAFYNCCRLSIVNFPSTLKSIGDWAFGGCIKLMVAYLPKNLEEIGDHAFVECAMTAVSIPKTLKSLGLGVYGNCKKLTTINVDEANEVYHSSGNCVIETATKTLVAACNKSELPTDNSITSIGDYAFYNCDRRVKIELPSSITKIGNYAFSGCSSLIKIFIPHSVTTIGDGAFLGCTGMMSIELPSSITHIGSYAFQNCLSLKKFEIPKSVTYVGKQVFNGSRVLTDVYCEIESQPESWDSEWVLNCYATVHWGCTIDEDIDPNLGDVDLDGKITADDYITLKRIVFGTAKLENLIESENAFSRCDVDRSRKITADDYIVLKRIYFGTYIF